MSIDTQEIAALMYRAKSSLDEAMLLMENQHCNTAVNRIYYSCFYAVNALLISKGIVVKSHSGVKQMFGLHFVIPGIISKESSKFYTEMFEMRQEGDYEFLLFYEKDEVSVLFEPAQQLLAQVSQYLSQQ